MSKLQASRSSKRDSARSKSREEAAPPLSPITRYEHHQQHGFLSLKHAARLIRGRNSWLGTEYGGSDFSAFFIDGKLIASFFLPATEIPVPIPAYFWREVDAATVARSRDSSGRLQPPYKAPVTDAIDRYIKELNLVADSRDMTDLEAIDPWLSSRLALHASYNPTDLADLKASVHSLIQTLQEHRQGPPQLVGVLFEDWERFLRTHVEFPVTLKSRGARPITAPDAFWVEVIRRFFKEWPSVPQQKNFGRELAAWALTQKFDPPISSEWTRRRIMDLYYQLGLSKRR